MPQMWFFTDCEDASDLDESAFFVREVPRVGFPPNFTVTTSGNTATITFPDPIKEQTWTCVKYALTNEEVCMGYMPADVNVDRTSAPSDILAVIDNLNGVVDPPFPLWQCDVDRSGVCGPPDILRVIDLLNGAASYRSYLNLSMVACP